MADKGFAELALSFPALKHQVRLPILESRARKTQNDAIEPGPPKIELKVGKAPVAQALFPPSPASRPPRVVRPTKASGGVCSQVLRAIGRPETSTEVTLQEEESLPFLRC